MRNMVCASIIFLLLLAPSVCLGGARASLIFATYAGDETQLSRALVLAESIRTFGGAFKDAPIRVYVPESALKSHDTLWRKLAALGAEVETCDAPAGAHDFEYARKVFAAAKAEAEAKGAAPVLVWMDDDTVVLAEPRELALSRGENLAYRPVTHRNIGSLYAEKPDAFWSRVYRVCAVPQTAIFPMKTAADGATIRPYINAGLLAVRPERGIMKKWAESFTALSSDPAIVAMCAKDKKEHLFLHQAALAGAVLALLGRNEMTELSDGYNYPLFFDHVYGAPAEFNSLTGVVTLRYDTSFQNPAADWDKKLKGPRAAISWLAERFGAGRNSGEGASTKMRFRFQQGGGRS
jgi:hypothetical protein